jgi:hypothetical protein
MARLMDRIRGLQSGDAPATHHPAESRSTSSSAPSRPEIKAGSPEPQPAVQDLSEWTPRVAPPELTSNISAMRDLANLSARSALDAHNRKRLQSVVWGKLIVCFVAMTAAAFLTCLSGSGGRLAVGAALVSAVIAVIWGVEYLLLFGYSFWLRVNAEAQEQPENPPPQA